MLTSHYLTEGGNFANLAPVGLKAQPDALRPLGGALFASQGLNLSRVSWPIEGPKVETAALGYSANVNHLVIAADGTVVIPSGPYGVLRLFGSSPNIVSLGTTDGTLLLVNSNGGTLVTGSISTQNPATSNPTSTGSATLSAESGLTFTGTSSALLLTSNTSANTGGTLTLNGSNSFSGTVSNTGGTLVLSGGAVSPVQITPGAVTNGVVIESGAILTPGSPAPQPSTTAQ